MKLFLFNMGHNGDVHKTRSFVRDIMSKTSFDEYYYLHDNNPSLLKDISDLKYDRLNEYCDKSIIFGNTLLQVNKDNLYINITSFVDYNDFHKLNESIYSRLQIKMEKEDYYFPEIDYSVCETENIRTFLKDNSSFKVLMCNGNVNSFQCPEIDTKTLTEKLSEQYPEVQFILTDKKDLIEKENVLYTDDIINISGGDLNEISYLSTFCDIIIGKSSAPDVFSMVKENLNDTNKTFISFASYVKYGFHYNNTYCNRIWINQYDFENIYETISNEIKRKTTIDSIIRITKMNDWIYLTPLMDIDNIQIDFYDYRILNSSNLKEEKSIYFLHKDLKNGITTWVKPTGYYNNEIPILIRFMFGSSLYFRRI